MNRNIKGLAALLGKLTLSQAAELSLTGDEIKALASAKDKIDDEYKEYVADTEKRMVDAGSTFTEEHAAAIIGYIHMPMTIRAIKIVREHTGLGLAESKEVVEEAIRIIGGVGSPNKNAFNWLLEKCRPLADRKMKP